MEKEFTELLYQNQGIIHKICSLYFNNRIYQKSLYLIEFVIKESQTFSFEKQSKISTLKNRIAELENGSS